MNSFTEENYIKAIYHLSEDGKQVVSTNSITELTNTKASSVTDMLKKLADKSLINYIRYQGVTLTAKGRNTAVDIVRKHRLWELFLVDKLQFKWDEVHDIAEELEHIKSDILIDRLEEFLGNPRVDPHGDLIPDKNGKFHSKDLVCISKMNAGEQGVISGVREHSTKFLQYLEKTGLILGSRIVIREIIEFDGSVVLLLDKKEISVSREVAKKYIGPVMSIHQSDSLSEVHGSVRTGGKTGWRKLLAFIGPAYLVSVGYMDPGNWATDIAGGSQFGYSLIWVLLMSNLIALLLQSLSARLGIVRGLDLAQASRSFYPRLINFPLYLLAQIAIIACDLAEIIGMAIGLNLLFGLPLIWGISITITDTFLLLFLMNKGMRMMEVFILSMVFIVGVSFLTEMFIVKPEITEVLGGFEPSFLSGDALYIAIGIIGATVMPHNLYLHSALVQTRKIERSGAGIKDALRFNLVDTTVALNLAFLVNAAILILSATAFFKKGLFEVAEIQDAYRLLENIFGSLSPALFAIALIASGQSSTITGTLAGQIVMEGHLNLRIEPWLRRLITRLLAIIPALFTILYFGEGALGGLLVLSQVVLSLQLGFAVVPLIHFNSDKTLMKEYAIKLWVKILAWLSAFIIIALNVNLVIQEISAWLRNSSHDWWIYVLVLSVVFSVFLLLVYVFLAPLIKKKIRFTPVPHGEALEISTVKTMNYEKIGITVDFSGKDRDTIRHAVMQGGKKAKYYLIHVVETAGARFHGREVLDMETKSDAENLEKYQLNLRELGYDAEILIGYGSATKAIAKAVNEQDLELLVMGAHGHKGISDLIFGTTVSSVRHKVNIPVLIVK